MTSVDNVALGHDAIDREQTRERRESFSAFALNSPAIIWLVFMAVIPIGWSFWTSLHSMNLRRPHRTQFIGLDNYFELLHAPEFLNAIQVTAVFAAGTIAFSLLIGLLLALLLNEEFPGRSLVRALTLVPWAMPPVVVGLVWSWIYDGRFGLLNAIFKSFGIIRESRAWALDPDFAMASLITAQVWHQVPFVTIVFLAALQTIPDEFYEAAKVDGASRLSRFFHITLPWLSQAMLIVLITQTMEALRVFDLVFVLTGGGPGDATTVLGWLTYTRSFSFLDFGRGNSYAFVMAFMTLLLSVFYIRLLWKRGEFAR
ncbi:sugar ABC transporter permease [Nitratireductor sp. XY-223]|uniref:carbohydrate ABC transporter permease n=1 Tax=Nitratireductor sp. XY-223 TaxID=2561926 RepID=UPI00145BAB97|nr:sugar ABC transporter permease [Nitratireductor sp. XY-223]